MGEFTVPRQFRGRELPTALKLSNLNDYSSQASVECTNIRGMQRHMQGCFHNQARRVHADGEMDAEKEDNSE